MWLGEVLNIQESICNEFKEFCIKKSITDYSTRHEVDSIVESGQLTDYFNNLIYDTLQQYFISYVPKYASAFSNCESNGTLYIGINDVNEVTGVPCIGVLDTALVKSQLVYALTNYIRCVDPSKNAKLYTDNIKLHIEELSIDMALLCDNSSAMVKTMHYDYIRYKQLYKHYLAERDAWLKKLQSYTCKLSMILKNKNEEICTYITHTSKDKHITHDAIEHTKSSINVTIDCNIILMYKDTPSHFIYWLLRFKDDVVSDHLMRRPKQPHLPRSYNIAYTLLTQLSDLRHKFLCCNKDIKYYLIKIELPSNVDDCSLEYKHQFKNVWNARKRVLHTTFGPCLAE